MIKVAAILVAAAMALFYFTRDLGAGPSASKPKSAAASFEKLAHLPDAVQESSGLLALPQKGLYLTHNDAGNKPYLYEIDEKGGIEATYKLNIRNVDWEDLAKDDDGYVYIAETGNNNNNRRELMVYKLKLDNPEQVQKISFTYEDQKAYPPSKKDRNFDVEAIFYSQGSIYLVTKDRGQKATAKVYKVPAEAGTYTAKLIGSSKINAQITGADISPDEEKVALLSEGKIHLFTGFDSPDTFYKGKKQELRLKDAGQTEGIAFEDEETLVITSEGGNLYRYHL
ncbi:hypothetical protein MKJ04_16860 [Pontibacter sp. E15-1]|uniref:hypothetical protein n=1 Tax=Pontibacter sp. E15-1 TaxID=2919918 RepID=UPI001F4F368F|nr:hypothetical protein [Pontibacter sp. E15-1]MCJ8166518.1 hypothetical protein [Pontibacter sp. E15-1]